HLIRNSQERTFAVRVTREASDQKKNYGYVITFDDITELVVAQRTSAWADVARRIAHEIKNPLTPIQLSAERIKRKYGKAISEDVEVFNQCTDTIIRQVGDIGRMVDEFSSFARMPKPVMEENDVRDIVRDAVFLFHVSNPEVKFKTDLPKQPVTTLCDRRLISQAVTNLVKNATESIQARREENGDASYEGKILVRVRSANGRYTIEVIDNGKGLPKEGRNRLVEPYMTTRTKGTGLGLAIVQKITEQHGGTLQLRDAEKRRGMDGGACIKLDLPLSLPVGTSPRDGDGQDRNTSVGRKSTNGSGRKKRTSTPSGAESAEAERGEEEKEEAPHGV
ncbi:MAG: PAS domain-containing sensor histidine kinase, partial [Alphaproteobacteria bacterium]